MPHDVLVQVRVHELQLRRAFLVEERHGRTALDRLLEVVESSGCRDCSLAKVQAARCILEIRKLASPSPTHSFMILNHSLIVSDTTDPVSTSTVSEFLTRKQFLTG
jgi:NifB/MoaA-like Fe-S oxidoreductase